MGDASRLERACSPEKLFMAASSPSNCRPPFLFNPHFPLDSGEVFLLLIFCLVPSSRAKQLTSKEHTAYRGYTETLLKWAYGCYSTKTAHRSQFMELGGLNLIDYWCFLVPSFVDRLALVHLLEIEEAQCHLPVLVKGLGTQIQMYSLLEFGSCQW